MTTTNLPSTPNIPKMVPLWIPWRCVNCNGYGEIGRNPRLICKVCGGAGYMRIPAKEEKGGDTQ